MADEPKFAVFEVYSGALSIGWKFLRSILTSAIHCLGRALCGKYWELPDRLRLKSHSGVSQSL